MKPEVALQSPTIWEFKISSQEGISKLQDAEGMVNVGHMKGDLEWDPLILTSDSPNSTNVRPNLSPERMNPFDNQLLHTINRVATPEPEPGGTNRFIRGVVPGLKIRIVQGIFANNSFRRIEVEQSRQEIDHKRIGMGDEGGIRNPGLAGKSEYSQARAEPTWRKVYSNWVPK